MGMNWEGRNVGVYGHTLLVEESLNWKGRSSMEEEERERERRERRKNLENISLGEWKHPGLDDAASVELPPATRYFATRGSQSASHPARPPIVSSWGSWRLKLSFNLSSHVREGPINGDFLSKGKIQPIAYFASFTLLHSLSSLVSFVPFIRKYAQRFYNDRCSPDGEI